MKLRKRQMIAVMLSFVIVILDLSGLGHYFTYEVKAVTFEEINQPNIFLKQVNGDKLCTLVAATMLIRRSAMMSGNMGWADITLEKVMAQAWVNGVGLKHTFTYEGITVNKGVFAGDPVQESLSLLNQHPEGIVLYDQIRSPRSHAVFLTDYTDGIFYSADPSDAVPAGRIPETLALVQVKDAESYWYVSSPSIVAVEPSRTEILEPAAAIPVSQEINQYPVTLSQMKYAYDGTEKKPAVTVSGLTEGKDYLVFYMDNISQGMATVVIAGIGGYSGTVTQNFEIVEASAFDLLSEIKVVLTKQSVQKGKTASAKVTLPDTMKSVQTYSSDPLQLYQEVKLSYGTDNKSIASVNAKGVITGKKKGTTKITVSAVLADGTQKSFSLKIKVI